MVFKRRDKPTLSERLQVLFYPRKGWLRGMDYLRHRVKRLPGSPHTIAIGVACGTLLSFTPLFGLHIALAMFIAYALRGNIIAAFIATWVGNPITFPFIATAAMQTGWKILGIDAKSEDFNGITRDFKNALGDIWAYIKSLVGYGHASLDGISRFYFEVFLPYLIGGVILGIPAAIVMYLISRPAIGAYQHRRREKLLERRRKHK